MNRVFSIAVLAMSFVAGFAGAAFAATVAGGSADPNVVGDALRSLVDSFSSGNLTVTAALAVVFAVAVVRKYVSPKVSFLQSDMGVALLVMLAAFGGSVAAAGVFSVAVLWASLKIAAGAAGGYALVKIFGRWLMSVVPMPAWAKSVIAGVLFLFDKPGAAATDKAESAGDAAVKANPPTGVGPTAKLP